MTGRPADVAVEPDLGPALPDVAALAAVVVAFAAVAGPVGAVAGLAVAVVRTTLDVPTALAAGHVALVALFPDGIEPAAFAVAELALLAVLLAPGGRTSSPARYAATAVVGAAGLAGAARLGLRAGSVWLAAGALVGLLALLAYVLHRYALVRLGLVPDDAPTTDP